MILLYIITLAAVISSLAVNRLKTKKALSIAWKKFSTILPQFLTMISLLAVFTTFVPVAKMSEMIQSQNSGLQLILALALGSIIFVPGFIAFPLAAVLIESEVPYYVVAAFTSSLMMVGFASMPVEITYFGNRSAWWRNLICLLISLLVALVIGFFYGEF